MIFQYPKLEQRDQTVLGLIREQRTQLRHQVNQNPIRWTGFLRKNTFARAIQGSNTIEGINANLAEAIAIIDDERPETLEEETIKALQGYRNAMTYVIRVHEDPHTEVNTQFIRSLHFMMLNYDMTKLPGQWRNGPIYVVRDQTGDTEYEGPSA
jgi:Fic family protein